MPETKTKKRYRPLSTDHDPRVESPLEDHLHHDTPVEIDLARLNANTVIGNTLTLRLCEAIETQNELIEKGNLLILEKLDAVRKSVDGCDSTLVNIHGDALTESQFFTLAKFVRDGITGKLDDIEAGIGNVTRAVGGVEDAVRE